MTAIDVSETPRGGSGDRPLWLGAEELRRALAPARCLAALEEAFRAPDAARAHRALAWDVADGVFHVKASALTVPRAVFVAKINANFPGNPARGLPTIQGVAALFDAAEGRLLALLDSPELTALRTAAATALAARYLARRDATRLLVCGCGRQARAQVAALLGVLPIARAALYDLVPERAARLADDLARELGLATSVVPSPAAAARASDVIVTCTTARSPILGEDDVAPGTFVAAVGADHPEKQELAPRLVARARLFVDSEEQAAECGELHHALAAGAATSDSIAGRLDQLVRGERPGRRDACEITLFDSTGIALEDAAAALAAWQAVAGPEAAGQSPP